MHYHAIPCNTVQYHAIPCNTMQYMQNMQNLQNMHMHDLNDLSETLNNCNQGLEAQQFTINWNWKSICNSYDFPLFLFLWGPTHCNYRLKNMCGKEPWKRGKVFATKGISCFLTWHTKPEAIRLKFIFYGRGSNSRNLGLLGSFVTLEIFVDLQQFLTYGSDGLMYRETCSKRTLRT